MIQKITLALVALLFCLPTFAQIYEPEGINMPGSWNGFVNEPTNNLYLANKFQVTGGKITKLTDGNIRWQAQFLAASSGGNVTNGAHTFLFTSGPAASGGCPFCPFNNKWANVSVSMNTLQSYTFGGGTDNSVTLGDNKWYTINWEDNGYTNTNAIFMETSAQPVTIAGSGQSPVDGLVSDTDPVVVSFSTSASLSAEELIYVRYSTDGFATSSIVPATVIGTSGTATIPALGAGLPVSYYIFSTTISSPAIADIDMVTINADNNGGMNYSYTVNPNLPQVSVTFVVDMAYQTVTNGVNISGSFNGYSPTAMTNTSGTIWEYTALFNQGVTIQYKFRNDLNWENDLGVPCGSGNRNYTTGAAPTQVLPTVCFGSCDACASSCDVTFQVNMSNETVGGNVYINGSFNPANWSTPQLMTNQGGGLYTYTTSIPQGSSFEYKFVNGASYELNISGPCGNGFNRTHTAAAATSETIPLVCFNSCTDCVAPPLTVPVTFYVNMGDQTPSPNGIHIAGSFTGVYPTWDPAGISLTDIDNNGVYQVTLNLFQNTSYQYKFINGNAWGSDEFVPGECNVSGNRQVITGINPVVLPVVCLYSCSNCSFAVSNDAFNLGPISTVAGGAYPTGNCYNGNLSGATVSPQGNSANVLGSGGQDVWYKVVAQSTALRVVGSTSAFNMVLELHAANGSQVDVENDVAINGGEIMAASGLTPGAMYHIAVRSYDGAVGPFSVCVQILEDTQCDDGSGTYSLCSNFKPDWSGANSYTFNFTPTGLTPGSPTSASSSSAIALSNPSLALRYGGTYDVTINATYNLMDAAGNPETITVPGTSVCAVSIAPHGDLRTKSTQRCPATVLKGTTLQAKPFICGAINHTITFREVGDCLGTDVGGIPFNSTTTGSSSTKPLSQVSGVQAGKWYEVTWTPNFAYGAGTPGTTDIIQVGGSSSASLEMFEVVENEIVNDVVMTEVAIYPNPSNGETFQINLTNLTDSKVEMRILDNTGKMIFNNQFTADGSLNSVITLDQKLPNGIYLVQFVIGDHILTEKLMIEK
jgi:hypothetical protein